MKLLYCITSAIIFFASAIFPQEHLSIHELSKKEHATKAIEKSLFDQTGKGIVPLKYDKSQLTSAVFGYLPDWEYSSAKSNLKYELLTHIAAFDFAVDTNGSISNPSYWPWTDVINAAHSAGVKIIMCVTNFTASQIHKIITDQTVKQTFFANVKSKITQYSLDGVNIDFESVATADRGTLLNTFMSDLSSYVHANNSVGKEVSFAGPAVNWGGWNLLGLTNSCDYVFIMGYDFYGSWSAVTGPSAPLSGTSYSVQNTVTNTSYGYGNALTANSKKLILGVPYYGQKWTTKKDVAGDSVVKYIGATTFDNDQPNSIAYGVKWSAYKTPWYSYKYDATTYAQVWFDNDSSLGLKYDLAKANNLKGVGMWALGQDGSRQELWNMLKTKFYSSGVSISGSITYPNYGTSGSTAIAGVKVYLKTNSAIIDSTTTDASGAYTFTNKTSGAYSLSASSSKTWGGVNSTDALILKQYVTNAKSFDSLQIKAADVNVSGSVNSTDALLMRQRVVGIISSFKAGDWVFENPAVTLTGSSVTVNLRGLCVGDVNGSNVP
jgi:spore germination protein YaaH